MVIKLRDSNVGTVQNTDMVTVEDDRKSHVEWPEYQTLSDLEDHFSCLKLFLIL